MHRQQQHRPEAAAAVPVVAVLMAEVQQHPDFLGGIGAKQHVGIGQIHVGSVYLS